jgi:hypothetical protein
MKHLFENWKTYLTESYINVYLNQLREKGVMAGSVVYDYEFGKPQFVEILSVDEKGVKFTDGTFGGVISLYEALELVNAGKNGGWVSTLEPPNYLKDLKLTFPEKKINERLALKPGPRGWELYRELVAKAYADAPEYDPDAAASFKNLEPFINNMFKKIQSRVDIEFVDYNPYENDQDMRNQVAETGILKIWEGGTQHPIFSDETNLKLRAVHDYMAHIQAIGSSGTGFDMKGEIQAYNTHLKTIPPSSAGALFTEVVGQASFFLTYGYFPEQKIAFLPGFDYFNVGIVDGYDIVGKELIKTED